MVAALIAVNSGLSAQNSLCVNAATLTIQQDAILYVNGDMYLNDASRLSNLGHVFIVAPKNRTANFFDNSPSSYYYGPGTIAFQSENRQQIKTKSRFGRIEVNTQALDLLSNVSADNWLLSRGTINTGAYYAIVVSSSGAAIECDAMNRNFSQSWFNGNLRRYISPFVVNNYQFPVGDASGIKLCEMDNLTRNPLNGIDFIDANFTRWITNRDVTGQTERGKRYTSISNKGVWRLLADRDPIAGTFDLKLYPGDLYGLVDNSFSIVNNEFNEGWQIPTRSLLPADGSAGRTVASGFAKRNNVSTFNYFALASGEVSPDPSFASLTVYPDPVINNEFFIRTGNSAITSVRLFASNNSEVNINGFTRLRNDWVKVNLSAALAKGMYTLNIVTNNGIRNKNIIVQ